MHTITSRTACIHNTMYGRQANSKWPTIQNRKSSSKKLFPWVVNPQNLHRPVRECSSHFSPSSTYVKCIAYEERALSTIPWPTLSEEGCVEGVIKVLPIRHKAEMTSHLLYKCQRARSTCLGEKNRSKSLPQVQILLWNKGLFVLVLSIAKVLWKVLEYFLQ